METFQVTKPIKLAALFEQVRAVAGVAGCAWEGQTLAVYGDFERAAVQAAIDAHYPTDMAQAELNAVAQKASPNIPFSDAYEQALASYAKYFGGE